MKLDKISDKLKFLKKVTSITNEKLADLYAEKFPDEKGVQRTFERYLSGEYDDYKGKDKRIDKTLKKFSEVFAITYEKLKYNNFFTTEVGIRMQLDKVYKIQIGSELLEFDGDTLEDRLEEFERNEHINSIIDKYKNMDILHCYKILKFYDDYNKISEKACYLICCYACLNKSEKEELRNYIFSQSIQTAVRLDIKCFIKNDLQLLDELYEKADSTDDSKIHELLSKELETKLNVEKGIYLEQLNDVIAELPTMDLFDWQLIEYYYSLNYQERKDVLQKCNKLLEEPSYFDTF